MPGPAPKHPSARTRRNQASTAATLQPNPDLEAPTLPGSGWHAMTLAWWQDIWASPMAPEYDDSDKHGLFMLAQIVDDFWTADKSSLRKDLAAEIRQQGQRFGLSPIDRRRLQWEIERTEDALDKGARRRIPRDSQPRISGDPRAVLRAL